MILMLCAFSVTILVATRVTEPSPPLPPGSSEDYPCIVDAYLEHNPSKGIYPTMQDAIDGQGCDFILVRRQGSAATTGEVM
jgi:hypothetical protein